MLNTTVRGFNMNNSLAQDSDDEAIDEALRASLEEQEVLIDLHSASDLSPNHASSRKISPKSNLFFS